MRVVAPGTARLGDQCGEDSVVSGNGSGVRATRRCTGSATPRLEYGDTYVALGTPSEGVCPLGAVAVALEVERNRTNAVCTGQIGESVCGVDDIAVADADDGVPCDAAPTGQRHNSEVAALGDQRDAAAGSEADVVTPHGSPATDRDDPIRVRADHRQCMPRGRGDQCILPVGASGLSELGCEDDRATAAESSCGFQQRRAPCRRGLR